MGSSTSRPGAPGRPGRPGMPAPCVGRRTTIQASFRGIPCWPRCTSETPACAWPRRRLSSRRWCRPCSARRSPASRPVKLTVPPAARVLARTPYWRWHGFGIERRRAEVIIGAARSAARLEATLSMDMAAAYLRLQAFPGVGPWTAALVAAAALGDPDAVPVGDYNLPHSVGYALEGTPRSTDQRMLELLEPYRGHRARVIRLIAVAGIGAPRFGPRLPLRDFARS